MKRAILIILTVLLCLAVGVGAYELAGRAQRGRVYEDLKKNAVLQTPILETPCPETVMTTAEAAPGYSPEPAEKPTVPSEEPPEPTPTPEPYVSPIDFDYLRGIDPNIFAWIRIEGTNIDYPIVKHPTDDEYYLNHTIEGYAGYPGSIYSFGYTAADFSQFNTIIYGHNMAAGTMFANLNNYGSLSYLEAHPTVQIFTPEAEYNYRIFACVMYDDRLIDSYFDQRVPEDRQEFLDSLEKEGSGRSYVLYDVAVDVLSDHIITLETCHGVPGERTVVVAVREYED